MLAYLVFLTYLCTKKVKQHKNNRKMITYLDTYNHDGLTYEDYKEFCEDNDITPEAEDSQDFYDWLAQETEFSVEDFRDNLKYAKFGPVSVSGRLGLWCGSPSIETTKFDNILDAFNACVSDAWDVIVTLDKGILTVQALHHDGRNVFTIHREHGYFWPKHLF